MKIPAARVRPRSLAHLIPSAGTTYISGDGSNPVTGTDGSGPKCTITYANPILPSGLGRRFGRRHSRTVARLLAMRRQ